MQLSGGSNNVGSAEINDDSIVNDDINSAAAIAFSKLAGVASSGANTNITSLGGLTTPLSEAQGGTGRTTVLSFKIGQTTKNAADASATQNIAHGLGAIPKLIRLNFKVRSKNSTGIAWADVIYDGTTTVVSSAFVADTDEITFNTLKLVADSTSSDGYSGTVTMDGTNIAIAWTKIGNMSGTIEILWEVIQ